MNNIQSDNPPTCVSHPCGQLQNVTNGEWKCHHAKEPEGEVCSLNCNEFWDPSSTNTTVCADSQWHPDPTLMSCITCKSPLSPLHGQWNCQSFNDIPQYNFTAKVCYLQCDIGYTHSGTNITICSMTGENTWNPDPQISSCERIVPECESPDWKPPHGNWDCDDSLETCVIACDNGFATGITEDVEIGCGLDGDWCSADVGFSCQPACEDLPALVKNGTWSCEEEVEVGPYIECILKCDNGTRMLGDGLVSCGLGQVWTGQDDSCTGMYVFSCFFCSW